MPHSESRAWSWSHRRQRASRTLRRLGRRGALVEPALARLARSTARRRTGTTSRTTGNTGAAVGPRLAGHRAPRRGSCARVRRVEAEAQKRSPGAAARRPRVRRAAAPLRCAAVGPRWGCSTARAWAILAAARVARDHAAHDARVAPELASTTWSVGVVAAAREGRRRPSSAADRRPRRRPLHRRRARRRHRAAAAAAAARDDGELAQQPERAARERERGARAPHWPRARARRAASAPGAGARARGRVRARVGGAHREPLRHVEERGVDLLLDREPVPTRRAPPERAAPRRGHARRARATRARRTSGARAPRAARRPRRRRHRRRRRRARRRRAGEADRPERGTVTAPDFHSAIHTPTAGVAPPAASSAPSPAAAATASKSALFATRRALSARRCAKVTLFAARNCAIENEPLARVVPPPGERAPAARPRGEPPAAPARRRRRGARPPRGAARASCASGSCRRSRRADLLHQPHEMSGCDQHDVVARASTRRRRCRRRRRRRRRRARRAGARGREAVARLVRGGRHAPARTADSTGGRCSRPPFTQQQRVARQPG